MGRRLTTGARYAAIPREYDGCVYAVEFTNGIVKVGHSRNPRTRMDSLANQVRRKYGARFARFYIGRDIPAKVAAKTEREVLRRLSGMGNNIAKTTEFFTGIRFGVAVNLIRQMSTRG